MLSPALTVLRGLVFPPACEACGSLTSASAPDPVCEACARALQPIEGPRCPLCVGPWGTGGVCPVCQEKKTALDAVYAGYAYEGALKKLLHAYKFRRRRALGPFLTRTFCAFAVRRAAGSTFDAVVAVPPDRSRLADRGFHPPAVFARALSKALGLPDCSAWLGSRPGRAQVSLSREERLRNVRGKFYFRSPGGAAGRRLLLVDDVFTTGSTVNECAWVLQGADAASVTAVCLAR